MKTRLFLCLLLTSVTTMCTAQAAPDWSLTTLPPGGEIFGKPGAVIGWGYNLENRSPDRWLLAYNVIASAPMEHAHYVPSGIGEVLAPNSAVSVPFSDVSSLVSIQWDADAPAQFVNAGTFTIYAGWYDGDPFNGGEPLEEAAPVTVPYRATVVPEPASMCALALGSYCLWRRRRLTE